MSSVATALLIAVFCQSSAPAVHRIHLRNGDYIEGRIHAELAGAYEIKVDDGALLLSKSQVSRIEPVRLRLHETIAPPGTAKAAPATGRPAPKYVIIVPLNVLESIRFRVDAALAALKKGAIDREDAMRRILACGSDGAIHLTSLLEYLDLELREFAGQCVAVAKDPATLPLLIRQFQSEEADMRATAVILAGMLGDKSATTPLRPLLKDSWPPVRAAAATACDLLDDPTALDFVGPLCADPYTEPRIAALSATINLSQRHGMRESMLWSLDRALRWPPKGGEPDILRAVGACGDAEAWTLASPHLSASSDKVRAAAAMALGMLRVPESSTAILERMDVELRPEPRIQLAIAAERLQLLSSSPHLIEWLSESDEGVRRGALRALRTLSGQNLEEDPAAWREWWKSR